MKAVDRALWTGWLRRSALPPGLPGRAPWGALLGDEPRARAAAHDGPRRGACGAPGRAAPGVVTLTHYRVSA